MTSMNYDIDAIATASLRMGWLKHLKLHFIACWQLIAELSGEYIYKYRATRCHFHASQLLPYLALVVSARSMLPDKQSSLL